MMALKISLYLLKTFSIEFKPVKGLEPLSVTYEATALAFELHRLIKFLLERVP